MKSVEEELALRGLLDRHNSNISFLDKSDGVREPVTPSEIFVIL